MRFSIYLFDEKVIDITKMLTIDYHNEYEEISINKNSDLEFCIKNCKACIDSCTLLVKRRKTLSNWVSFFESDFNICNPIQKQLENLRLPESFIYIVGIPLEDEIRHFALTGGYGYTKINKTSLVRDFGIKTALNMLDDTNIKQIDVRKLTSGGEQKFIFNSSGKGINDFVFDINFLHDVLKKISGKTDIEKVKSFGLKDFDVNFTGKEQLSFTTSQLNLLNLAINLKKLLNIYKLDKYKDLYEFIDNISVIRDEDIINYSKIKIIEEIKVESNNVSFLYPENKYFEENYSFNFLFLDGDAKIYSETNKTLNIKDLYYWLNDNDIEIKDFDDLDRLKVICNLDNDSELIPIYDLIICEFMYADNKYIVIDGECYQVHIEFEKMINEKLKDLKDEDYKLGNVMIVDKINRSQQIVEKLEDEEIYNDRIANNILIKYDQVDYNYLGHKGTVELCDVYDITKNYFIHIKFGEDASKLSHLFSQGFIAAQVLKEVPDAQKFFIDKLPDKTAKVDFENMKIYYAICPDCKSRKTYRIPEDLSIFNKINLIGNAEKLKRIGVECKVIKLETSK